MKLTIREFNSALIACQREKDIVPKWVADLLKETVELMIARKVEDMEVPDSDFMKITKDLAKYNEQYTRIVGEGRVTRFERIKREVRMVLKERI